MCRAGRGRAWPAAARTRRRALVGSRWRRASLALPAGRLDPEPLVEQLVEPVIPVGDIQHQPTLLAKTPAAAAQLPQKPAVALAFVSGPIPVGCDVRRALERTIDEAVTG